MSIIFLKVKKGFDPYKVARDIDDAIVEVDAVARKDIGKNIINTLRDISRIFTLTIIIASMLAAFLAWAVFSAIANERAREIGIMRALGAKESHVVRLFLSEVLLIGGTGSILGIICGTTLSFFLSKEFSIMKNLAVDLSLSDRVFIGLSGLVIGTTVCVIGALRRPEA